MRAASIKPKLALRSLFAARSDGCSLSAFGTRLLRDSGTVWVVDDEGARDESVIEESASAMLWVSLWEMRGETFNTVGRPRRERRRKAKTMGLRTLGDGGSDGGGRASVRAAVGISIFIRSHKGRSARTGLSSPSASSF